MVTAGGSQPQLLVRIALLMKQVDVALPELKARTDDAETQVLKVRQARPEGLALREPKATKAGPGTNLADPAIAHGQPFVWPATIF
jgi:hypothetical protein